MLGVGGLAMLARVRRSVVPFRSAIRGGLGRARSFSLWRRAWPLSDFCPSCFGVDIRRHDLNKAAHKRVMFCVSCKYVWFAPRGLWDVHALRHAKNRRLDDMGEGLISAASAQLRRVSGLMDKDAGDKFKKKPEFES